MISVKVIVTDDAVPPPHSATGYEVTTNDVRPNLRKLIQSAADGALEHFVRIGHESWRKGRVLTPEEIEKVLAL